MHPLLIIFVGALTLLLVYTYKRWRNNKLSAATRQQMQKMFFIVLVVLLLILAASGRMHWLFAAIASAFGVMFTLMQRGAPLLLRFAPFLHGLFRQYQSNKSPNQQQASKVETATLRLQLDHDTGELHGTVLAGQFIGKSLHDLSPEELVELYQYIVKQDEEAVPLIQAFIERYHPDLWQRFGQSPHNDTTNVASDMTTHEAYDILGISKDASEADIISAHRKLMQKLHPDRGGSTYLAAKVNQAKSVLLNHKG
ncbi:MAG: DnaJ domain-containing protein [Gammaproteobacteria bacterium]|nr:DnaJ domain-containing protein [Gammaproteobacteria bacterium]